MPWRTMPAAWAAAALLAAAPAAADETVSELGPRLAAEALADERAGARTLELSLQETNATLQHNAAVDTVNGSNHISGNAFSHATGFPLAVQNSGNNVIIQNAFIIRLDMQ